MAVEPTATNTKLLMTDPDHDELLEAAFHAWDGVPRVVLYDNLKSAVTQRIGDAIVFNADLSAFASHYGYEARPVAPYRGDEKGRVERTIRDVRTSFFAVRTWVSGATMFEGMVSHVLCGSM